MLEGINFVYDGIKSVDMGLINCKIDGGMFEETFLPSREIKETSVSGKDKPYFQNIRLSPLEFELTFAFEYGYSEQRLREVARWLMQDYYKPFYIADNESRIFYCMPKGDSKLFHNGMNEGYITLTMRCDSPYSYTNYINKDNYELGGTKLVKSFEENTFTNEMGTQTNIKINNGSMTIDRFNPTWEDYADMNWSDLDG